MSIFKEKQYLYFLSSSLLNSIANETLLFLMPWIILNLTNSPFWMGNIFLIQSLPSIIVSPTVGFLVDKYDKKYLISYTNILMFLLLIIIYMILCKININIYMVCILTILFAILNCFSYIEEESIVVNIVNESQLTQANSLYQISETIAVAIGPSLAGVLLMLVNIKYIFLVISVLYLPMTIISRLINYKNSYNGNHNLEFKKSLRTTYNFLKTSKLVRTTIIFCCLLNISLGAVDSMFIYFSNKIIGINSSELGIIISTTSVAQFAFSFLCYKYAYKFKEIKILIGASSLVCLGIFFLSISNSLLLVLISRILQVAPVMIINIINKTIRQKSVPPDIIGRINSINGTLSMVSYPLSGFFSGIICLFFGARELFFIVFIVMILSIKFFIKTSKNLIN